MPSSVACGRVIVKGWLSRLALGSDVWFHDHSSWVTLEKFLNSLGISFLTCEMGMMAPYMDVRNAERDTPWKCVVLYLTIYNCSNLRVLRSNFLDKMLNYIGPVLVFTKLRVSKVQFCLQHSIVGGSSVLIDKWRLKDLTRNTGTLWGQWPTTELCSVRPGPLNAPAGESGLHARLTRFRSE